MNAVGPYTVLFADRGTGFVRSRASDAPPPVLAAADNLLRTYALQVPAELAETAQCPIWSLRLVRADNADWWCFLVQGRGGSFGPAGTCQFIFVPAADVHPGVLWHRCVRRVAENGLVDLNRAPAVPSRRPAVAGAASDLIQAMAYDSRTPVGIDGRPEQVADVIGGVLGVLPAAVAARWIWSTCLVQRGDALPGTVTGRWPHELRRFDERRALRLDETLDNRRRPDGTMRLRADRLGDRAAAFAGSDAIDPDPVTAGDWDSSPARFLAEHELLAEPDTFARRENVGGPSSGPLLPTVGTERPTIHIDADPARVGFSAPTDTAVQSPAHVPPAAWPSAGPLDYIPIFDDPPPDDRDVVRALWEFATGLSAQRAEDRIAGLEPRTTTDSRVWEVAAGSSASALTRWSDKHRLARLLADCGLRPAEKFFLRDWIADLKIPGRYGQQVNLHHTLAAELAMPAGDIRALEALLAWSSTPFSTLIDAARRPTAMQHGLAAKAYVLASDREPMSSRKADAASVLAKSALVDVKDPVEVADWIDNFLIDVHEASWDDPVRQDAFLGAASYLAHEYGPEFAAGKFFCKLADGIKTDRGSYGVPHLIRRSASRHVRGQKSRAAVARERFSVPHLPVHVGGGSGRRWWPFGGSAPDSNARVRGSNVDQQAAAGDGLRTGRVYSGAIGVRRRDKIMFAIVFVVIVAVPIAAFLVLNHFISFVRASDESPNRPATTAAAEPKPRTRSLTLVAQAEPATIGKELERRASTADLSNLDQLKIRRIVVVVNPTTPSTEREALAAAIREQLPQGAPQVEFDNDGGLGRGICRITVDVAV